MCSVRTHCSKLAVVQARRSHQDRPAWTLVLESTGSCETRVPWQVLLDKDEVALCCIRKRANDAPRLHALVPQAEVRQDRDILAPEGFHVIPLPFADDLSMSPPLLLLSLFLPFFS
jgi:hypothetical protein